MRLIIYIIGWIIAGMMVMHPAAAGGLESFQSHESITGAARQLMLDRIVSTYGEQPEIVSDRLDSRLRLRKCSIPLQAFLPESSRDLGKITVGVKCADSKPWSLHVPVTVSIYKQVVVAARTLQRGTLLTDSDVTLASYDLADLTRGYFEDTSRNLGMKLKRRLTAGEPLTFSIVEKPRAITRGQQVHILVRTGAMEVRSTGKALDHGAVGERIGVMNLSSQQKLEGIVTDDGEIRVDM